MPYEDVTPAINKEEIEEALKGMKRRWDQTYFQWRSGRAWAKKVYILCCWICYRRFSSGRQCQCDCTNLQREEGTMRIVGIIEASRYHEDLRKNNRQKTEEGDEHRRRAVRFHARQRDNWCHICSEAGDRETPGVAEGTVSCLLS